MKKLLQSDFIARCKVIFESKYDYSLVDYKNTWNKVDLICVVHGKFKQRPQLLLNGNGCQKCGKKRFNPLKPAILYYISINNGEAYKIGITNRTIKDRFNGEKAEIKVLMEEYYISGAESLIKEKEIIEKYKEFRYSGKKLLNCGHTEMFYKNILNI